jgi:tetratricopeptide (TPR) repeat protein
MHCREAFVSGGAVPDMLYVIGTDGQDRSSGKKFKRDIELLSAELAKNDKDARSAFYLAQSLRDDGQSDSALEMYKRRSDMLGWDEETYVARTEAGKLAQALDRPWEEVLALYLRAHEFRPTRAEAMYYLSRYFRIKERYELAYRFGVAAMSIPQPPDRLFVESDVYRYKAIDEAAIAASWLPGRADEALALNRSMFKRVPDWDKYCRSVME